MDKNSAIGLTLIAALLLAYFLWFSPQPKPPATKPVTATESVAKQDSSAIVEKTVANDSALAATYGDLSSSMVGEESVINLETEDIKISFSTKGGVIKELELKKFKTYSQKALKLVTPATNEFKLLSQYKGQEVNLYALYY